LDTGLTSTDFTVSATGIQVNTTGTDGDHVMSPKTKEYYNVSGVQGYSCELLMTKGYDINYLEDILTTGFIDLVIHY
jgi:hypothetical protein